MLLALHRQVALSWRQLDDEWVAYDAASGRTLQLDAVRATLLTLLEDGPLTLQALAAELAAAGSAEAVDAEDLAADLAAKLDGVLQELAALGLIDRPARHTAVNRVPTRDTPAA